MSKFAVILAAAGKSSRFQSDARYLSSGLRKKPFALLNGRAVWLYSAERFGRRSDVAQIILVVSPEDREEIERLFAGDLAFRNITVVSGGAERFLSVENALKVVDSSIDYVAVHDAARPCITDSEIERVFAEAERRDAAILACPVVGSLKRSAAVSTDSEISFGPNSGGPRYVVSESASRDNLWEAQTPQVFAKELLLRAYRARSASFLPTDDCGLVEALGVEVAIVPGSRRNIKITSGEDLSIAGKFLELNSSENARSIGLFR